MQVLSVQVLTVTEDEEGQRVDNYLISRLKGVPKSAVYRIIRKGEVRVNKGRVKPDRKLSIGDQVRIPPMKTLVQKPPAVPGHNLINLLNDSILYDQDGLMVVNKPSGLAVHGGSGVNLGLIEALRQLPGTHGFLELVHRLDKETSGCVMIARKRSVLKKLQEALRLRKGVGKNYLALVQGAWPKKLRLVDVPLKRNLLASGERVVRVSSDGKSAQTRVEIVKRYDVATLVKASPITGRTHQIRVHCKHGGCPLVGDEKYGDTSSAEMFNRLGSSRLFLHAASIELNIPDWEPIKVEAPLPEDLVELLSRLPSAQDKEVD